MPPPAPAKPAPLNADEIRELQGKLKALGFDPGAIDGVVGPTTLRAVRKYSQARAIANSEVTRDLLVRLRSETPPKI
ncbi:MAG: peptidoglycan-binding domain-containing protein [Reyranella sp.]